MKSILTAIIILCAVPIAVSGQEQTNTEFGRHITTFDVWDDIPFHEEKARLDEIAQRLQEISDWIIYMEIYAGQRACVGEAKARAERAKNYLVRQKKIDADRFRWRNGGYREEATVMVWIVPPDWPILNDSKVFTYLEPVSVKFDKNCKIKYRGKR